MTNRRGLVAIFAVWLVFVFLLAVSAQAQTRAELWRQVAEAKNKGLPQTAIEHLQKIYQLAQKDKDMVDAAKSLCDRIIQEGTIQGNRPEERIIRLENEIATANDEVRPLLNIILAKWYWHFYQRNSFRFIRRSRTDGLEQKDFTTWDLPKLFAHIGNLYETVLHEEASLQAVSIKTLSGFLEPGNQPENLRPTLFDFFAHEALTFYMADAQSAAKPVAAFEIRGDSPAFGDFTDFLRWTPETTDTESCNLRAIKLLQRLIKVSQSTDNLDALLDNDLLRLSWVRRVAVGDQISATYLSRLEKWAKTHATHALSTTALAYAAQECLAQGDNRRALGFAEQGASTHSGSHGAALCAELMARIKAREVSLETERVVLPKSGQVRISYKNIERIFFRLLPRDVKELFDKENYSVDSVPRRLYDEIFSRQAVMQWSVSVDPGKEHKTCETLVDLPELKTGLYYLAASVEESFSESSDARNALFITPLIVTQLGMIVRRCAEKIEVFTVDNLSGKPLENVEIRGYSRHSNQGWQKVCSGVTDKNGMVSLTPVGGQGFFIAEHRHNVMYCSSSFYISTPGRAHPGSQVYFFTDRSLYRPGQTIYFKGIVIQQDKSSNDYRTFPAGTIVNVILHDPNHQEVKQTRFKTNEFGSFSGSFIAPADRLTGAYTLLSNHFQGSARIRVEEYKRPKFKVVIDTPTEAFQLGKTVQLTGRALSYTGARIDGGRVNYRVVREVRCPPWCWWYFAVGSSQEIAHGTTETDQNGEFIIKFDAVPDLSVPREDEPVFVYTVTADVTDAVGETRSGTQIVRVGYSAQSLNILVNEVQDAHKTFSASLKNTTLDGKGVAGDGNIQVFALKQPDRTYRKSYLSGSVVAKSDKSDIRTWQEEKVVLEQKFNTDSDGNFSCALKLAEGAYRIKAVGRDQYTNQITAVCDFMVINNSNDKFSIKIPFFFRDVTGSVQPGETFQAFWATGYDRGPAYIEIEHRQKVLQSFWTDPAKNKSQISMPVAERHRGGFIVRVMQIKDNREYFIAHKVTVPWSNKQLQLKFAHITSKMQPAQKDTWTIEISGEEAEKTAIEMVAAMYDASLDAFASHRWPAEFPVFYQDFNALTPRGYNGVQRFVPWKNELNYFPGRGQRLFPQLPTSIQGDLFGYHFGYHDGLHANAMHAPMLQKSMASGLRVVSDELVEESSFAPLAAEERTKDLIDSAAAPPGDVGGGGDPEPQVDLDKVAARSNLNETAFFLPHLVLGSDGQVAVEFTIPEALTTWNFLAFAHGKALQAGQLVGETITQKDLMVQPNPPRFLRGGDKLAFTAKVTNLSDTEQNGKIRLKLLDSISDADRNAEFKLTDSMLEFSVAAGESRSCVWHISVPDTPGVVKYTVVGSSGNLSDGEEGLLPILSRHVLVTESLPLPIKGPEKKKFAFRKLLQSQSSDSLVHQGLTVEVTSNPAWYAVQALPYLIEFPHECSEQIFNRVYANSLAAFIANSDPKIKRVFDTWKMEATRGGKALFSNLEKNEHLKSVALLETPWVLDAKSETEQKHKIGILFERARIEAELMRGTNTLAKMQMSDGGFSWFPGGRVNSFITLYIMTGYGRLRHLGVDVNIDIALKTLNHLDHWIDEVYRELQRFPGWERHVHINPTIALYLYGRSFFLKERPIPLRSRKAVEFFLGQAVEHWLKVASRLAQGHIALALKRFGKPAVAADIVKSIKERSVVDEELGRFWRENELSFWWYRAEIETQAVMIEMFDEVANDLRATEDCKIWLLKQKQTQNWKTTKATADAVYALLLRGTKLLAADKLVKVLLAGKEIKPQRVEAGTGFYQKIFAGTEVKPEMGNIELIKEDQGIAWGAVHWQYLEDMSKLTPHQTNLKLTKTLFVKRNTDKGPTISPLKDALKVGDLLVVRIELRVDRDMEFIHMKDQRGSGLEPTNTISCYKYQDGLAYYEATKDTATHFYIDYLPKGTYVFEYDLRVQLQGTYQSGMAEIQCMYAPEFNSHSESFMLHVRDK